MSELEYKELNNKLIKALEIAEYQTLKRKAMLNENVVHSDENGNPILVPARQVFVELYNEPVPTF
mgnify:CR=1 FL=1